MGAAARTQDSTQSLGRAAARRRQGRRSDAWGRAAERAAAEWYERKGARVLAERARTAAGEIDLVLRWGDVIVFTEVKARRSLHEALAVGAAADWERRAACAEAYAAEAGLDGDLRLDFCAMDRAGNVEVVENASVALL